MVENERLNESLPERVMDEMLSILKEEGCDADLLSEIQRVAQKGGLLNDDCIMTLLEKKGREDENS